MKLHEGERLLHELRPRAGLLVIWFFTKCLPVTFVAAFASGTLFSAFAAISGAAAGSECPFPLVGSTLVAASLLPVAILLVALVYCGFLLRSYIYYITDQRCVFHGGILRRVERSVPYHKVTDVEISQHIGERILGISKLQIFTPGTGSMMGYPFSGQQRAEISFVGLKDSETPAETINGILSRFRATGE